MSRILSRFSVIPWWLGFSLSLGLPLLLLGFLLTGPHVAEVGVFWLLPVPLLIVLDGLPFQEKRLPTSVPAEWFSSFLLCALVLLAPLNLVALGSFVQRLVLGADSSHLLALVLDLLALRMLGGTTLCCAVIAPAHELMHRRPRWVRTLARGLLLLVFADFFYFAHRAGHHRYLGTREDPSTARRGELYGEFWRRSVRAQWQIAFRFSRQGVWRGLFLQIVNLCLFGWFFGLAAALIWVYLSAVAIRLLEAVNYFQHYGLIRQGQRDPVTAWRCDSAISYFLFLGLTRHDDHHQRPAAPFVELVSMETGPELPMGYLGVAVWVKNWSRSYARWALARLDGLKAPEAV